VTGGEEPKGIAGRGTYEQARSFHRAAAEYDRGRPGWPPAILDLLPLERDATVLDLGAGTGKLTRILVDRYTRVIAVEPLDELRAILAERAQEAEVRKGAAEAIPLADGELDGVFAGQAFHWFANDNAVAEIARVLRPGGVLAVLWNHAIEPSPLPPDYRTRLAQLHDEGRPAEAEPDIVVRSGFFGAETESYVDHEQVSDREDVLAFAASVSWIAMRDDRDEILAELSRMLPPGEYGFPMRANVAWAIRN
jgi:SAM-dependent methyltransferase